MNTNTEPRSSMKRYFLVFTNPITGAHVVGEPEGPPLAKFEAAEKAAAETLARSLTEALELAHRDRDGYPLNPLQGPPPTTLEARGILRESLKCRGHVWLTGEEAFKTLTTVLT